MPDCECGKHNRPVGQKTCPDGCECGKHHRPRSADWSDPDDARRYYRERARVRRAADPTPNREAARKWREANPGYPRVYKYGISLADMEARLTAQAGLCYLCNEPLDAALPRSIVVDHDHSCCRGERSCGSCVRGLACRRCNYGVSQFGDDPERMRRVADNLEMANTAVRAGGPPRSIVEAEL